MAFDLESLSEATSGAIGALVSTTVSYPLDTCKTKYQAEVRAHHQQKYRNISDVFWEAIASRQVLSLYQGLGTKNLQSFISQFVYFYGYSFFKRLYLEKSRNKTIGTKANLIVAAAAGACTVIVTQPLDTASSKMQTSEFGKSRGLWKTLSEGTWSEAFDGLGISLLLTSNPSIQYTVFDQLKRRLLERQLSKRSSIDSSPEALSAFSAFVLGAVSKCIATCVTYPAIRCKVTLQAAESDESEVEEVQAKTKTISGALYSIWKNEGAAGFFKGLLAQNLKTVLSSALLLMIKEKISKTTWFLMLALKSDGQLINDLFTVDLSKKNWVARELRLSALYCVGVCGICIGLILKWVCYFLSEALCIIIFFQIQGCPKVADALKKTNEKSVLRKQIWNKLQRSLKRFVEHILSTVVSISSWLAVLWDRILHQGFIL
ncbi:hypothetical protein NC653_025028 [Populus alba x Populus x berolinensis]|uniref:Peroxisomal adenine nucleotide carrier 1-like n=2 Tax=Populus TaxID=3689 RepID=A0A4U5M4U8_POPAL|nr:hypothetical protein NC653_025028 [Populus alba x Populus x berolinensis]TKR63876.1 hypothetical protein D5086_0000322610 [Populus alba]